MNIQEFAGLVSKQPLLSERQLQNLNALKEPIRSFHKAARIPLPPFPELTSKTRVLESGHQPNFLPHAGIWRKAFLLRFFGKKISNSFPLFGFSDYDLCTASVMAKAKFPVYNKQGSEPVGVNVPKEHYFRRFNLLSKPPRDRFEKEVEKLLALYNGSEKHNPSIKYNLSAFTELLWRSYELAGNYSDMNAFFFSKLCSEFFGFSLFFFRLSDVQSAGIFSKETEAVISKSSLFNSVYENSRISNNLSELLPAKEYSVPFWHDCVCGSKVQLFVDQNKLIGTCPVCKSQVSLALPLSSFSSLSPNAVARNIVYSEGLGSSLFISGAGGSLKYGIIANAISKAFSYRLPPTLALVGKDHYLGFSHLSAVADISKLLKVDEKGIQDLSLLESKAKSILQENSRRVSELEKKPDSSKQAETYKSRIKDLLNRVKLPKPLFSETYSAIDLFSSVKPDALLSLWSSGISGSEVRKDGEFYKIFPDFVYSGQENALKQIYTNLTRLGDTIGKENE